MESIDEDVVEDVDFNHAKRNDQRERETADDVLHLSRPLLKIYSDVKLMMM